MYVLGRWSDGERPLLSHPVGKVEVFEEGRKAFDLWVKSIGGEYVASIRDGTVAEPLDAVRRASTPLVSRGGSAGREHAPRSTSGKQKQASKEPSGKGQGRGFTVLDAPHPAKIVVAAEGSGEGIEIPGLQGYVVVDEVNDVYGGRKQVEPVIALPRGSGRSRVAFVEKRQRGELGRKLGVAGRMRLVTSVNDKNRSSRGSRLVGHTGKGGAKIFRSVPGADHDGFRGVRWPVGHDAGGGKIGEGQGGSDPAQDQREIGGEPRGFLPYKCC